MIVIDQISYNHLQDFHKRLQNEIQYRLSFIRDLENIIADAENQIQFSLDKKESLKLENFTTVNTAKLEEDLDGSIQFLSNQIATTTSLIKLSQTELFKATECQKNLKSHLDSLSPN
jgi:hypothetical protein